MWCIVHICFLSVVVHGRTKHVGTADAALAAASLTSFPSRVTQEDELLRSLFPVKKAGFPCHRIVTSRET
ncbi:hypothetical protein GYMLUDRAFT_645198 [Collybiopsis luxurians FD-317 M1]|nr:hypothetical protein GYMLUDRAFT_645198 [Collybiopsis luxurians FD-317 M1]